MGDTGILFRWCCGLPSISARCGSQKIIVSKEVFVFCLFDKNLTALSVSQVLRKQFATHPNASPKKRWVERERMDMGNGAGGCGGRSVIHLLSGRFRIKLPPHYTADRCREHLTPNPHLVTLVISAGNISHQIPTLLHY